MHTLLILYLLFGVSLYLELYVQYMVAQYKILLSRLQSQVKYLGSPSNEYTVDTIIHCTRSLHIKSMWVFWRYLLLAAPTGPPTINYEIYLREGGHGG